MTRVVGRVDAVLDTITDLAVASLAVWTLLYHVDLIAGVGTDLLILVWAIAVPLVVWFLAVMRRANGDASMGDSAPRWQPSLSSRPAVVALGLAVVAAVLIATGTSALWWPGWAAAGASVIIVLVLFLRHTASTSAVEPDVTCPRGSVLALVSGVALGIFSVFTMRPDPDDTFYVNRATWVAQHGTIPTRDVIFSNQHLPALPGAGVPVASIEAFQGAVAHVFHIAGGTAAFLLTPPVGTFLAVWAIWRLIRAWASRRYLLALAAGIIYLLWAGKEGTNLGVFFLTRMQQGKVIYVAMLVPVIYLYLHRWVKRPVWPNAALLVAAGGAAIGLTSSATFLVPLVCATAALPLLLLRRFLPAFGALLPAAYPAIAGVVVHFKYPTVDQVGIFWASQTAFHAVLGAAGYVLLATLAVFTAVWFVRDAAARLLVIGIGVVLVIICAPLMFSFMNALTGAHAVLWRTIWVVPAPVLVGLLATVPLPVAVPRWVAPIPAVAIAALLVATGYPSWGSGRGVTLESSPTWRYIPAALTQARAIERVVAPGSGPILAPRSTMRAIALTTTLVHAVDPRPGYVKLLSEPADDHAARQLLSSIMYGTGALPSAADTASALRQLNVSMVCVSPSAPQQAALITAAGYVPAGMIYHQNCFTPPAS